MVVREDYGAEKYIHAERAAVILNGGSGFATTKPGYIPTAASSRARATPRRARWASAFPHGLGRERRSGFVTGQLRRRRRLGCAEGASGRFLYDGMTQLSRQPSWFTVDRCGNRSPAGLARARTARNAIYALG